MRDAATCRVCGGPMPTDRRSDQQLCSQRCRQRLTDARDGRDREKLLTADAYLWKWAYLERRRLTRKGEQPTKEQERLSNGWRVMQAMRAREGNRLLSHSLEVPQLQKLATLRKAVVTAMVAGLGTKKLEAAWSRYLEQLRSEQEAERLDYEEELSDEEVDALMSDK